MTDNAQIEQWMAAVLDDTNDLMAVIDEAGTIRFVNGVATRRLGYAPAEMIGRSIADFIHPDDLDIGLSRAAAMFISDLRLNTTLRILDADGTIGWWEITRGAPLGNLGGRIVICRDVTSRTAEQLIETRRLERLQHAVNLSQTALDIDADEFIAKLDGVCAAVAAELGVDRATIIHFEPSGTIIPLARAGRESWAGGGIGVAEIPRLMAALSAKETLVVTDPKAMDDEWIVEQARLIGPHAASLTMPMMVAGSPIGAFIVTMNSARRDWTADDSTYLRMVTETIAHVIERSRVVGELRSSEAMFRLLSDAAADVILLVDADGLIRYASPSSRQLLGEDPDELVGTPVARLGDPDHPHLLTVLEDSRPGSVTVEGKLRRADGTWERAGSGRRLVCGVSVVG